MSKKKKSKKTIKHGDIVTIHGRVFEDGSMQQWVEPWKPGENPCGLVILNDQGYTGEVMTYPIKTIIRKKNNGNR